MFRQVLVALTLGSASLVAAAAAPDEAELVELIRAQQAKIAELESRLEELESSSAQTSERLEVTEERLVATSDYVAEMESGRDAGSDWSDRTSLGGYGEMHLNRLDADDSDNDVEEIDFHRFVLFANHRFSDRLRLFTELEVEHSLAGDGAPGEVELEQAYVEYDLDERHLARAGLFLLPIGFLNETHEPETFYGVERNDVENVIIPTTWWEGGLGASGRYGNGVSWDFAVHSGLQMPTAGSSAFRVRSGRQKVAEATASDFAYTGRLRYTGIPGLDLGVALQYQSDPSQISGDGLDEGLLVATHLDYRRGGFGLRGLYAEWNFEGDAVEAAGVDEQDGWFMEPSYRFDLARGGELGLYGRYEDLAGARTRDRFEQWELGVNWWLHPRVVLKADWRDREHDLAADRGRDFQGFDLGLGYSF